MIDRVLSVQVPVILPGQSNWMAWGVGLLLLSVLGTLLLRVMQASLSVQRQLLAVREAARLDAYRCELVARLSTPLGWRNLLAQVLADVLPHSVCLGNELPFVAGAVPYFAVDDVTRSCRYVFTPAPHRLRGAEAGIPLTKTSTMQVEVLAVWSYLNVRLVDVYVPAVSREQVWYVVAQPVVAQPAVLQEVSS